MAPLSGDFRPTVREIVSSPIEDFKQSAYNGVYETMAISSIDDDATFI
jgi:hypothetical protein